MSPLLSPEVGLLLVLVSLFALSGWLIFRYSGWASQWVMAGLLLRLGGSMAFLYGISAIYGGGDYLLYFREGTAYANELFGGPAVRFTTGATWWGTTFISRSAGVLFAIIGPTLPGAFLVYSVFGFLGTLAFWIASCRAFPALNAKLSLIWLMTFPSLFFWPSSLGKDSIVLLGLGLTMLGFVGRHGRTRWAVMVFGLACVFVIRPQMVAVLVLSLVAGQTLATLKGDSRGSVVRVVLLVAAGVGTLVVTSGALGFQLFSVDATTQYIEARSANTSYGGSAISSDAPLWLAPITALFRPFLWEANGPTAFVAALETTVFWVVLWVRRKHAIAFMKAYRRSPVLWMGVAFVVVYATAVGLSVSNLGTLTRQRIHVFPFLILPLAGLMPRPKARRMAARPPLAALVADEHA